MVLLRRGKDAVNLVLSNPNPTINKKYTIYYSLSNVGGNNTNLNPQETEIATSTITSVPTTKLTNWIFDLVIYPWNSASSWLSSALSSSRNISYSHSSIPRMEMPPIRLPQFITNPQWYSNNINADVTPIFVNMRGKIQLNLGYDKILFDLFSHSKFQVALGFILFMILLPFVINNINAILDPFFSKLKNMLVNPIFGCIKRIVNWFSLKIKNIADNNSSNSGGGDITSLYNIIKNYNGSNGGWDVSSLKKAALNNSGSNGEGDDGDDDDDRNRDKFFTKDRTISPLPILQRMLEIIRQIIYNYIPMFRNSLAEFEAAVTSLASRSLAGITHIVQSPTWFLDSFRNALIDFNIRILESYIMLNQEIERLRQFIIDNVSSSVLDSAFILLETELEELGDAIRSDTNDLYLKILEALQHNRGRLINNIQLIRQYLIENNDYISYIWDSITDFNQMYEKLCRIIRDLLNL